jgi:hypothetical protein
MSIFNQQKKKISLVGASILVGALTVSPLTANAAVIAAPDYLQQIAQYTKGTMDALNKLPQAIEGLAKLATVFTEADDGRGPDGKVLNPPPSVTPIIQATLTGYSGALLNSLGGQLTIQNQLLQEIFGPTAVANADDLSFQTLVGIPYSSTNPLKKDEAQASGPAYSYIRNAAGLNLTHTIPGGNWTGRQPDQQNYTNYYNTVISVQTFNAYVLSQLYTDATNGAVLKSRNSLLQQASDPTKWLTQMASEDMGYVLREMLIYTANIYVMLSELLNVQKQLLTAQAMTNTLMVLTGQNNEQLLLQRAKAPMPGGG